MKTLVLSDPTNGTWLAEHLTCPLVNYSQSGNGLVTKLTELQDIWDDIVCANCAPPTHLNGTIYGWSPLTEALKAPNYKSTLLAGCGLKEAPDNLSGIPLGVMGWWKDGEWQGKPVLVIEQMGMMNRDLGVACSFPNGITILPLSWDTPLIKSSLSLLSPILTTYNGPVALRLLSVGKQLYVLDLLLTFPPGWVETSLELQINSLLDYPFNLTDNIAVGILVSVPPYPYDFPLDTHFSFTPDPGCLKHLRIHDCDREKGELWSGSSGRCFYATAWGTRSLDPKEARMRVYRSLRNLSSPGIQYRTDISTPVSGVLEQLETLKLI